MDSTPDTLIQPLIRINQQLALQEKKVYSYLVSVARYDTDMYLNASQPYKKNFILPLKNVIHTTNWGIIIMLFVVKFLQPIYCKTILNALHITFTLFQFDSPSSLDISLKTTSNNNSFRYIYINT